VTRLVQTAKVLQSMTFSKSLPNFLIIGAMKSGTTSLHRYLAAHPQIFMSPVKELDFFVEELGWSRGVDWYKRHFAKAGPEHLAVGEASTSYTKYPRYRGIPDRISDVLEMPRLVYVVRDPVERIRSHYEHNVVLGEEHAPLDQAIRRNPAYLDYSRYWMQLEQYAAFPSDRILVATSERLRHDRAATVADVATFLGVDPRMRIPDLEREYYRTGERPRYGPMVASIRGLVRRLFPRRAELWRGAFLTSSMKRMLGRRPERALPRAAVSDEARAWIETELRSDVKQLREYLPRAFDGWGIA
jgi:hypothetical protein